MTDSYLVHKSSWSLFWSDINTISGSVHLGAQESTCSVKAPNGADRKEGDAGMIPRDSPFSADFWKVFPCLSGVSFRCSYSSYVFSRQKRPVGRQGTALEIENLRWQKNGCSILFRCVNPGKPSFCQRSSFGVQTRWVYGILWHYMANNQYWWISGKKNSKQSCEQVFIYLPITYKHSFLAVADFPGYGLQGVGYRVQAWYLWNICIDDIMKQMTGILRNGSKSPDDKMWQWFVFYFFCKAWFGGCECFAFKFRAGNIVLGTVSHVHSGWDIVWICLVLGTDAHSHEDLLYNDV